jgi:hypothetical protein
MGKFLLELQEAWRTSGRGWELLGTAPSGPLPRNSPSRTLVDCTEQLEYPS